MKASLKFMIWNIKQYQTISISISVYIIYMYIYIDR